MSGGVDAAANLIDVRSNTADCGGKFLLLRIVHLDDKIIGTNDAGSFEVDTNITGMKHFLKVKGESVTNEVESSDFFVKAQEFIASMGGRI